MLQHQPTDDLIAQVEQLCSSGVTQEAIAQRIGICPKTLRLHYRETLDKSRARAHGKVQRFLFDAASGAALNDGASYSDCLRAAMFYLKTQCGWRETEAAANDLDELAPRRVVVITQTAEEFHNEENAK